MSVGDWIKKYWIFALGGLIAIAIIVYEISETSKHKRMIRRRMARARAGKRRKTRKRRK